MKIADCRLLIADWGRAALVLLLLCQSAICNLQSPIPAVLRDSVDLIEHNRFHGDDGRLVFEQLLYWDFDTRRSEWILRDWRLLKSEPGCVSTRSMLPDYDHSRREYRATWLDGDDKQLRVVSAPSFRRSSTDYDPELANRELLPVDRRRKLALPQRQGDKVTR